MRIVPIITAVLVTAFLFFIVVMRDDLMSFASAEAAEPPLDQGEVTEVTKEAEPATPDVRVVAIQSRSSAIGSAVILRGQTEADRQVEVRAETSAQVLSEPLPRGSSVKAEQVLCELEPGTRLAALAEAKARLLEAKARVPESQARLDEAYARLEEAEINNNAAEKLSEGGFASGTRVATTKASVRSAEASIQAALSGLQSTEAGIQGAEAAVAVAEREIERLTIRAPFAGLLESDTAEIGSLMQPGSLCATVIRLDPIKIVGFVPETDVARLKPGALAGARLTSGKEVTGLVTFLSRSADEATRTFRVEIDVPNTDLSIRDGQTAEIAITSDDANAHLIPQSALTLNDDGTMGVRTIDDQGIVDFFPVTIMRDSIKGIWVTGLEDQANVIIIGQEYVVKGVHAEAVFEEFEQ